MFNNCDVIHGNIGNWNYFYLFLKNAAYCDIQWVSPHCVTYINQQSFILLYHISHSMEILVIVLHFDYTVCSTFGLQGTGKPLWYPEQAVNRIYQSHYSYDHFMRDHYVHDTISIQIPAGFFQLNCLTYINGLYRVIHFIWRSKWITSKLSTNL